MEEMLDIILVVIGIVGVIGIIIIMKLSFLEDSMSDIKHKWSKLEFEEMNRLHMDINKIQHSLNFLEKSTEEIRCETVHKISPAVERIKDN